MSWWVLVFFFCSALTYIGLARYGICFTITASRCLYGLLVGIKLRHRASWHGCQLELLCGIALTGTCCRSFTYLGYYRTTSMSTRRQVKMHDAIIPRLRTIAQICRAISSQVRHVSITGKKPVKQQYLIHMYSQLRPTNGWDRLVSLRHPSKFQRVSCLASLMQRQ